MCPCVSICFNICQSVSGVCVSTCAHMYPYISFVPILSILPICVYMCPFVSICAYMCPHVSIYVHMYPYVPICVHMCPYVVICVPICVYMCPYVSTCVHMCPYVRICVHMCPYVSICTHMCPYVSTCVHMCPYGSICNQCGHVCRNLTFYGLCPPPLRARSLIFYNLWGATGPKSHRKHHKIHTC